MRRRVESVWPAFADLMTVIAITGMIAAAALAPLAKLGDQCAEKMTVVKTEMEKCKTERMELAKNAAMFEAIQRAEDMVDEFAESQPNLTKGSDQSLQFGEDLVRFELNDTHPDWQPGGRAQLREFCSALSESLAQPFVNGRPRSEFFTVLVEGHTDSVPCGTDATCNWPMSAGRAAQFRVLMERDRTLCPGGNQWTIVPVGKADTSPVEGSEPTRRIEVRLVPDYAAIIRALSEDSTGPAMAPIPGAKGDFR